MPDVVALPQSLTATAREPSTVSVLAVDDVPDNLDVLEALLADAGLRVLRAASG